MQIDKTNVGRIAERIAMNELEARGYHIIDLAYTSRTFANVDFIASKDGSSFNIQVKGTSLKPNSRRAVQYGYCNDLIIAGQAPMFNGRSDAALKADVIILMAVYAPADYHAVVLPVEMAEEAAQLNLSRYYRAPKRDGGVRKANKVYVEIDPSTLARAKQHKLPEQRYCSRISLPGTSGTQSPANRKP